MTWQSSPELENQADLYIRGRLVALFEGRERLKEEVGHDVVRRNVFGSGIHLQLLRRKWEELFRKHCEEVLADLLALIERHEALTAESADWIQKKFETHVDQLAQGMARTLEGISSRWRSGPPGEVAEWARVAGGAKGRGKLRLDTAVGESKLTAGRRDGEAELKTDVFISHASEDKDAVARPLAEELQRRGFTVWYDEFVLRLGDSLPSEIDRGLASCRFGVVILSPHFFAKNWPKRELDGLAAREVRGGQKVILPVWHQVDAAGVEKYSPTLAAKLAVSTAQGLDRVVADIVKVLEGPRATGTNAAPQRQVQEIEPETSPNATAAGPVMILGIVEEGVGRPRNDGTRGSALYPVTLRLSRRPSSTWANLFVETWNRPPQFTTQHRPGIASVEGDTIVLGGTTIEELEEVHRETLRHVLAKVNEEAARIEEAGRARAAQEAAAQREHETKVRVAASRFRVD